MYDLIPEPHEVASKLWANFILIIVTILAAIAVALLLSHGDKDEKIAVENAKNTTVLVKNYETLERAYDALVKETNALREERDRLQKHVNKLETELSTKKSKTTGEEIDHKPHICFRCYQNLNDKLTKDEMVVEENLLLERARLMKFARWRLEILPEVLRIE
jgi:predicted RNase H-like nuclease (RuvC/YqgF family)